ncbi:cytosine permease [Mycolicibacterium sp. YH-1]|uniref:purine-cytosine permease family protein n=1 Tax=Mycolicibacterium sp. YH-1 TaxID=2908837 RepID=UPI001F4BD818|nr:cytosine permease [Mycolicibacterium sp. YH-1]UNB50813.1 cytosine permease [Mycolicibacterium sp. YH-1]
MIEVIGIEPIPPDQQTSRPRDFFRIAVGAALATTTVILGTLPIAMGLSLWQAITAITVGTLVGALFLAPLSIFGSRTHTNNAVTSGAHFGVRGRIVGTSLSLVIAMTFFTVSVWVGGDSVAGAISRIAPQASGNLLTAVSYAVTAALIFVICVVGYRSVLRANVFIAPTLFVVLAVGLVTFWGQIDFSYSGHPAGYALGSATSTWVAAMLIAMANPLSFGPFLGDWSRYLPSTTSGGRLVLLTFLAHVVSLLPFFFGAATATLVPDAADYMNGLITVAPSWFVPAIVMIGLVGGISGGVASLYGTGLDFSSLVHTVSRVQGTFLIGAISIVVVFLGRFVFNLVDTVNSFLSLILILSAPWISIMLIGFITRRGYYQSDDLQVFTRQQKGGIYWSVAGFNFRALSAWIIGCVLGLLTANTPLITGPLNPLFAGVDVSFFFTFVVTGVVFYALLVVFPEPRYVHGSQGPRWVPVTDHPSPPIEGGRRASEADATPTTVAGIGGQS